MGIMVYSLLWVMQDLYHQPYENSLVMQGPRQSQRQIFNGIVWGSGRNISFA